VRWDWAEQLVPGGLLSVDLAIAGTSGGHVILHREPDRLTGRLCPRWRTCPVIRHVPYPRHGRIERHDLATAHKSTTTVDPHLANIGAPWLMFMAAPPRRELTLGKFLDEDRGALYYGDNAGSWAEVELTGHERRPGPNSDDPPTPGPRRVWQGGQRRLWTEFERAHQIWAELGEPEHEDISLTVTPDRQWLWFDGPGRQWREEL
jgi:hypothetical protein